MEWADVMGRVEEGKRVVAVRREAKEAEEVAKKGAEVVAAKEVVHHNQSIIT